MAQQSGQVAIDPKGMERRRGMTQLQDMNQHKLIQPDATIISTEIFLLNNYFYVESFHFNVKYKEINSRLKYLLVTMFW